MACEMFKNKSFNNESRAKIALCNEILEEYGGMRLTLRQLYYQFVSRDLIPNSEKSYKSLGKLVSDARLAGLIDWELIEDRGRTPVEWAQWNNIRDCVEQAERQFRLPRWRGQPRHVELWVEKQALAGVLQPIAAKWHITLMVNKGYSSQSAMRESAQRFIDASPDEGSTLLYLGDHDPSGEDMVRDIRERLELFGVYNLDVEKVALTMAQIKQYNPPPNPAKLSDSRAKEYIRKFGHHSWEVDALPPRVLASLIEAGIRANCDVDLMNEVKAEEEVLKKRLGKAMDKAKLTSEEMGEEEDD